MTTRSPCSRRSGPKASSPRSSSRRRTCSSATWPCISTPTRCSSRCRGQPNGRWQIWEIKADGTGLRQVTAGEEPDVDNYTALLPARRADHVRLRPAASTGVPCVGGKNTVANLCLMDADGRPRPAALLRPGPRLVPDAAERWPRALYTLGIHRFAPLLHAAAVPHESRRHGPGRVLQEQLALAELDVLRQADPRASDEGGRA